MTVDLQTCLKLSEAAYGGSRATTILQVDLGNNWIEVGSSENLNTGFVGLAYQNITTGEIVISYRGTDRSGLGEAGAALIVAGDNVIKVNFSRLASMKGA